ncbi:MAG: hypothetical protein R3E88_10600 [Myxococcota bacterium]|nr:hypothetical protein [Myxococcales bacterium]
MLATVCQSLVAADAAAGDFYAAGSLATTLGIVEPHGHNGDRAGANDNRANRGTDTDSSPVFAGVAGFEFPLRQALPRRHRMPRWMPDVDLDDWVIRTELELAGGRNYDVAIGASGLATHHVSVSQWALLTNAWLDLPLGHGLEAIGLRQRWLRDVTFNTGLGIGYQRTRVESTSFDARGKHSDNGFLWQLGLELGIPLSDAVVFTAGYRYVPVGRLENEITDTTSSQDYGVQKLDVSGHELRTTLRVRFWSVRFPRGLFEPDRDRYEP